MGLSDAIFLIDKLGITGVVLTGIFLTTMFMGSVVDLYQFSHQWRRHRRRRERAYRDRVRAEILMELHERKSH